MSTYIIEGNINFQEELCKLLNEDSENENEDDLCQITGLPLKDNFVTLECNHHFNYDALYKEIYKQKYVFKTYETTQLLNKDLQKFRDSNKDYFIKCPYCRNLQFTVLPYYKELGLDELYGINSLDKTLPNTIIINMYQSYHQTVGPHYGDPNYTFSCYGVIFTFKPGQCCQTINPFGDKCSYKYVATIPNTQLLYCRYHYRCGLRNHKMCEKKKTMDAKLIAKKEREEKRNERKKLLEEKNAEREAKGLLPLKRLPISKKNVENIVKKQNNPIQQYVPDEEYGCCVILKYGINKGKKCGCKKIDTNGLCKRHSSKDEINNDVSEYEGVELFGNVL